MCIRGNKGLVRENKISISETKGSLRKNKGTIKENKGSIRETFPCTYPLFLWGFDSIHVYYKNPRGIVDKLRGRFSYVHSNTIFILWANATFFFLFPSTYDVSK